MSRTTRVSVLSGAAIALIALLPAGAGAVTTVAPPSLDFGNQQVGTTSAPQAVTLTTPCTLFIPGVFPLPDTCLSTALDAFTVNLAPTGDFTVAVGDCPATQVPAADAPQATCTASVTFTPTADGARTGTLSTGTEIGLIPGPTVALSGSAFTPSGGAGAAAGTTTATKTSTGAAARKKCKQAKKRHASVKKKKCKRKKKKKKK